MQYFYDTSRFDKELICADWASKQIQALITDDTEEVLNQLGITEARIKQIPCILVTSEWAKNAAYIIATYFYPCNFSGWLYKELPDYTKWTNGQMGE